MQGDEVDIVSYFVYSCREKKSLLLGKYKY